MGTATFDIMAMADRVNARTKRRRLARVGGGAGLIAAAVWRGGVLAPILFLSGAALLVKGITNRELRDNWHRAQRWLASGQAKRFGHGTRDLVDEESWQSFPASDPPGHWGGTPGHRPV